MFGGAPPQNRRARLMLNALLRQRLKSQTRYEPSRRVLFAVIASLVLILGIMVTSIISWFMNLQDPARGLTQKDSPPTRVLFGGEDCGSLNDVATHEVIAERGEMYDRSLLRLCYVFSK